MNFLQTPNERRFYRQPITGDTVQDASWTLTRLDTNSSIPTSLDSPQLAATYAQIRVIDLQDGIDYELSVVIQTVNGEFVEGCGYINCRECT